MTNKLPPFSTLLKSRDVEDPLSVWVHRPLAYALVAVIHNTRVTPNQITLVAMLVGFVAAACWFVGTPGAMVAGGVLLWTSAILDGADGSLARAKQMQSDVGRALDGAADALVGAATVFASFYYLWRTCEHTWLPLLMPIALVTTVGHIYLYDYYKEVYLHATRPGQGPRTESAETVAARLERARAAGESLAVRFSLRSHLAILTNQQRFVRLTNPASLTIDRAEATVESAGHYRRYNYGPMQLWMLLSLGPHNYLMAIAAMSSHLELYLWYRAIGANAILVIALIWQRIATNRTVAISARDALESPAPECSTQV